MVEIKGLENFAPKDFPGFISSTVFLGGCNFRCPYCHNADLVLNPKSLPTMPLDYFISYLDSRLGWLEGICISGGEPLLDENLEVLLRIIKDRNLLVKVDTNGSFPSRLEEMITARLIDHVAMDVKAPIERYPEVTRSRAQGEDILRSVEIIRNSGLPHLFRTTAVPGLIGADDIIEIGRILNGSKAFQLQQFSPKNTVDSSYLQKKPYPREKMEHFAELVKSNFDEVRIEGV